MNDDVQFSCTACHLPIDGNNEDTMTACRLCGRIHCNGCVDEHGRCVECREKASKDTSEE